METRQTNVSSMPLTAGIIVIGQEILNGNVIDSNSSFLCQKLHSLGFNVSKVTIIPDNVDIISEEVLEFSRCYELVITIGGIGPTHIDVTFEGVARAFKVPLVKDERFESFYIGHLKNLDVSVAAKSITIPLNADVIIAELKTPLIKNLNYFPVVKVQNIFCLPSMPNYVQEVFTTLSKTYFQNSAFASFKRDLYLSVDVIQVAHILKELTDRFKSNVLVRIHPFGTDNQQTTSIRTKVSLKSSSLSDCLNIEKEFLCKISPKWQIFPALVLPDFDLLEKLFIVKTHLSDALNTTWKILDECFTQHNTEEIFLSFNGGKDCTILLNIIYYYYLKKNFEEPLKLVYFEEEDSFPEIDTFIEFIRNNYRLKIEILATPIKTGLEKYLASETDIKVCFLGVRNTDPKTQNLKPVQETDAGWPKLTRVFPILHWSYRDVWDFIRCVNIPYCSLYNHGYTSLGSKKNTAVNSELAFVDGDGSIHYRPAFLLDEDSRERHGREIHQTVK